RPAAEDDRQLGVTALERARERDRRELLLEEDREADEAEAAPVDRLDAEVEELARDLVADALHVGDRAAAEVADRPEVRHVAGEVRVVGGEVAERLARPDPLADHARPDLGERLVEAPADVRPEVEEQREVLGGDAGALERRLEEAELEAREARGERRH